MKIQPIETQLTGKWLSREGRAVADETCERINRLVRFASQATRTRRKRMG